ncbi:MAG: DNA replication/repair protein RecF [Hyphomicrobiales bacterium]|nr:DNA replication/repair protein RecF [Hyphomicrobiales bacterium]
MENAVARPYLVRLTMTDFRNVRSASMHLSPQIVVLTGSNGAGKTNSLEAVSLLAPGKGLRGANAAELTRQGASEGWSVSARLSLESRIVSAGTGLVPQKSRRRPGRVVKIDGEERASSNALGDLAAVMWLIPAMDGLFTGPAVERRRFLDRLTAICAPSHRSQLARFELAMRQRNRLLETGQYNSRLFDAYERQMAEHAVAIAAARVDAVELLRAVIEARRDAQSTGPFPWAEVRVEGELEDAVRLTPAVEIEDTYADKLRDCRNRDRAARRTLSGPHASDMAVRFGPKDMPARLCSTGEQKALLIGLVLAQAEVVKTARGGFAPIILLDEIAAHLDEGRREALFKDIITLDSQAWLTGTDPADFAALRGQAQFFHVSDGAIMPAEVARGGASLQDDQPARRMYAP